MIWAIVGFYLSRVATTRPFDEYDIRESAALKDRAIIRLLSSRDLYTNSPV